MNKQPSGPGAANPPLPSGDAVTPGQPLIASGVILADNDSILRGILRSVLTQAGQQVFVAADGREALDLARQFLAALIVLDVHMPRMDGLAACRAIRQLPGYATRPIVLLTADDRPSTRIKARNAGATRVFTKPFQIDTLLEGLAAHIAIPPALLSGGNLATRHSQVPPIGLDGGGARAGTGSPPHASWILRIARGTLG